MSTQDHDPDEESTMDAPGTFSGRLSTERADRLFKALQASLDEARFEFDEGGMVAQNVDPANVVMTRTEVPASAWETYESTGLSLGLKLPNLADLATTAESPAEFEWLVESHRLAVRSGPVDAELSAIDPDSVRTQAIREKVVNGMTLEWSMSVDALGTAVKSADRLHGSVVEVIHEDGWIGVRKLGDTDRIEVEFYDAEVHTVPDEDVRTLMNADYLKELWQSMPKDGEIDCQTATDWPFSMTYDHDDMTITHMQAPRLESG